MKTALPSPPTLLPVYSFCSLLSGEVPSGADVPRMRCSGPEWQWQEEKSGERPRVRWSLREGGCQRRSSSRGGWCWWRCEPGTKKHQSLRLDCCPHRGALCPLALSPRAVSAIDATVTCSSPAMEELPRCPLHGAISPSILSPLFVIGFA